MKIMIYIMEYVVIKKERYFLMKKENVQKICNFQSVKVINIKLINNVVNQMKF